MQIDEKRLDEVLKAFRSDSDIEKALSGIDNMDIFNRQEYILTIIDSLRLLVCKGVTPANAFLISFTIGFMLGSSYAEVGQLNASLSDKS